jgi:hypothetical protein
MLGVLKVPLSWKAFVCKFTFIKLPDSEDKDNLKVPELRRWRRREATIKQDVYMIWDFAGVKMLFGPANIQVYRVQELQLMLSVRQVRRSQ